MSCEQISAGTSSRRKEWMEINCQSVDAKIVKSGALTLPSLPSADGVYSLNSSGNNLTLVPSGGSSASYFQGTSNLIYNVGPYPAITPLQLGVLTQNGPYLYNPVLFQLTVVEAGFYELSLSTVIDNTTGNPSGIDTGFWINSVLTHGQVINQAPFQISTAVNSVIVNLTANSIVYPFAYSSSGTWQFYSTTFTIKKLG
jgi:hypothetical protein